MDNFDGVHPSPWCAAAEAALFAVVLLLLIIIVIVEVVIHQRSSLLPRTAARSRSLSVCLLKTLQSSGANAKVKVILTHAQGQKAGAGAENMSHSGNKGYILRHEEMM